MEPKNIINCIGWAWITLALVSVLTGTVDLFSGAFDQQFKVAPFRSFTVNLIFVAIDASALYFAVMLLRFRPWARISIQVFMVPYVIRSIRTGIQAFPSLLHDHAFPYALRILAASAVILSITLCFTLLLACFFGLNKHNVKAMFNHPDSSPA